MACKAEKRLQLQREACEAREAAVAARDARARLVRFEGTTVYCANQAPHRARHRRQAGRRQLRLARHVWRLRRARLARRHEARSTP